MKGLQMTKEQTQTTIPDTIKSIVGKSQTFSVGFFKKNGEFRTGTFRLGVTKNNKGGNQLTNPDNFLVAYDMQKKGYRNINYNTIKYIKAKGKIYHIDVVDNTTHRLMLMTTLTKEQSL
tara:strand:- start:39 stop:395 length:357 start_codon:yes stop_codon:yes gene_type:complete